MTFIEPGKFALGHFADPSYLILIAMALLEDDDVVGGIVPWPVLAEELWRELLASQAHEHEFPAKIGMSCDIAQDSLWNVCFGRFDGHAAAIRMINRDNIINVGVPWEDLLLDLLDCLVDDTSHALDGRLNTQNVTRSRIESIWATVALPRCDGRDRRIPADLDTPFHLFEWGWNG